MANDLEQRLRQGYRVMSERVHELLQQAGEGMVNTLEEAISKAREQAYLLGELSREEAQVVAMALKRDVEEVALALMEAELGLKQWVDTDLSVAERRLLERILASADPTTLEMLRLQDGWERLSQGVMPSGTRAKAGCYVCTSCGKTVHLAQDAPIPPCPHCQGTRFKPMPSAVM